MKDPDLDAVKIALSRIPDIQARIAGVLRATYDQIYNGQRTGRYRMEDLFKTEKTHFGSLVEINLRREFDHEIQDGQKMDYRIAGVEVDCKFSQRMGGWMIPREAHGEICLLVRAEDTVSPSWCIGLVRASAGHLNTGGNQDKKVTLNKEGAKSIEWLFKDAPMPPNALLQLDPGEVARIFENKKSGQQRINMLFRVAQKRRIGRAVIATVAQQEDYMKRVRGNGGARSTLKAEGIIILGEYGSHRKVARELAIPESGDGEFVAVRICPAGETKSHGSPTALIEGNRWRVAGINDPVFPAPKLPSV